MIRPPVSRAVADRSDEIFAGVLDALGRGETSLADLARTTGCDRRHLAKARFLYNLRLAGLGHECRIKTRLVGNRSLWRLVPISRLVSADT